METIIKIKDLKKVYRMGQERVYALNGINLDIKKGEICCLYGTSGSGKTTLLNMVAGLEKPTRGTTVIVATHEKSIVDDMEKRVISLDYGRIVHDVQKGNYTNEA
jgi:putative ABC transport system ATP-binding protein